MSRHVHGHGAEPLVPTRHPPARSFQEQGGAEVARLAEISAGWSSDRVEALRTRPGPRHERPAPRAGAAVEMMRSWPHGHVAAVLGDRAPVGPRALWRARPRHRVRWWWRCWCTGFSPPARTGRARGLAEATHQHAQPRVAAADGGRRRSLRRAGLATGAARPCERTCWPSATCRRAVPVCDVTSTYFEGRRCPFASGPFAGGQAGHTADRLRRLGMRRGAVHDQVQVFDGNTGVQESLARQVLGEVRERFGLGVAGFLVGPQDFDGGSRWEAQAGIEGLGVITALRAPAIEALVAAVALPMRCSSAVSQRSRTRTTPASINAYSEIPLLAVDPAPQRQSCWPAAGRDLAHHNAIQQRSGPCESRRFRLASARCWAAEVGGAAGDRRRPGSRVAPRRDQQPSLLKPRLSSSVIRTDARGRWPASETVLGCGWRGRAETFAA